MLKNLIRFNAVLFIALFFIGCITTEVDGLDWVNEPADSFSLGADVSKLEHIALLGDANDISYGEVLRLLV